MTMIVETVVFDRKLGTHHNPDCTDRLRKEMNAFSKWLILTSRICGFKYVSNPPTPTRRTGGFICFQQQLIDV